MSPEMIAESVGCGVTRLLPSGRFGALCALWGNACCADYAMCSAVLKRGRINAEMAEGWESLE